MSKKFANLYASFSSTYQPGYENSLQGCLNEYQQGENM